MNRDGRGAAAIFLTQDVRIDTIEEAADRATRVGAGNNAAASIDEKRRGAGFAVQAAVQHGGKLRGRVEHDPDPADDRMRGVGMADRGMINIGRQSA
ncbi:MAG: hypothetical protein B7Z46_01355, partial [Hydrogenophilales bacterium 12-64-6]